MAKLERWIDSQSCQMPTPTLQHLREGVILETITGANAAELKSRALGWLEDLDREALTPSDALRCMGSDGVSLGIQPLHGLKRGVAVPSDLTAATLAAVASASAKAATSGISLVLAEGNVGHGITADALREAYAEGARLRGEISTLQRELATASNAGKELDVRRLELGFEAEKGRLQMEALRMAIDRAGGLLGVAGENGSLSALAGRILKKVPQEKALEMLNVIMDHADPDDQKQIVAMLSRPNAIQLSQGAAP